jgi:NADH:ubiquinone oxidoreductase subunit
MTLGTRLYTWLRGTFVGADPYGNRYYRAPSRIQGRAERRWVIYKGEPEASKVPPEWHGWLHYTVEEPPKDGGRLRYPWQKEHLPNLTGTPAAYRPAGHTLEGGKRQPATGDYEPWTPPS